jgi:hypothetical protein
MEEKQRGRRGMKKEAEEDFVRMLWKKIQLDVPACSDRRF